MDNILRKLVTSQVALDLGCGNGSFHYASYGCRIIGLDVDLNSKVLCKDGERIQYVRSSAVTIPLADNSVDAIICNHTFEHFSDYKQVLTEINRVLKQEGMLWIAIPNGYSFDDALYRLLFAGGGHVNRFTSQRLISEVETTTDLWLVQRSTLFSGFVYLKKPTREQFKFFPQPARFLFYVPDFLNKVSLLSINAVTRLLDKTLSSCLSQCGWGFVFARKQVQLDPLPSYFNVCWKCGSGSDAQQLKNEERITAKLGIRFYSCTNCQANNTYFEPLSGLS